MPKSIREITEDLIRIRSTPDRPAEMERAAAYVADYFFDVSDVRVRRFESGGKPSLIISYDDSLAPDITLVGHLDVVPASDDLFEPRVVGSRMYGRGSCDMKSEVAVMMELMRDFAEVSPRPPLALILGCDEEVGGMNGVGYLVNTIGFRTRVALVPDGGEFPEQVFLKTKGVLHITVSSRGRAVHGSRPWLGENAVEKLFDVYKKVHALFPASDDPDHWYSTCVLGKFQGGIVVNQVPDHASCDIDIRFAEDISSDALLARVRACVGDDAQVDLLSAGNCTLTSIEDPYVQAYGESVRAVFDTDMQEKITHGATDGRFFSAFGIPVITSRPISDGQHTPDEWIDLDSLAMFKKLYADVIVRFSALQ